MFVGVLMTSTRRFTTIKDIALEVGVSASVVSFVLNGSNGKSKRYCTDELRKKILKTALDLNYIPSNAASNLKGKPRNLIAVLIPQFYNEFFTQMVLEIEIELEKEGYILAICNTFDDPVRESAIVKRMLSQRVDGFVIVPAPNTEELTLSLIKRGLPLVVMDRYFQQVREGYHSVLTQNYESSKLACNEIIKAGHENIAFIDWNGGFGGLELRHKAFEDLIKENNINKNKCLSLNGELKEEAGLLLTQKALELNKNIEGIVYANHLYALSGIEYLLSQGRLPGKNISVSIVGAPRWAVSCLNDFTCVDLNGKGIGKKAAQIMLNIIKGDLCGQFVHESIGCKLHKGKSI